MTDPRIGFRFRIPGRGQVTWRVTRVQSVGRDTVVWARIEVPEPNSGGYRLGGAEQPYRLSQLRSAQAVRMPCADVLGY